MTRARPKSKAAATVSSDDLTSPDRAVSTVGMKPGAHPTAPGGMSRKQLVTELVNKHDYEEDPAAWAQVSWPTLIDMVVEERAAREAEQPMHDEEALAEGMPTDMAEGDDPNPGIFYSAQRMFPDLSDLPEFDEGTAAIRNEAISRFAEGREVDEVLPVASDEVVMDPESDYAAMLDAAAQDKAANPPLFLGIPGVRDYIFDGHAGAGPSGAERWMHCTMALSASRKFLETLTPNQQRQFATSGEAARQGTTAHTAAEAEANFLLGRSSADDLDYTLLELTTLDDGEAYDEEMGEWITEYVDLVRTYAGERGAEAILVEHRVESVIPLTDLHEGEVYIIRGSLDFAAKPVKKHRSLVVGDLKYGNGIEVGVEKNPQIRIYALGLLSEMADEDGDLPEWLDTIDYYIAQPRLGGIKHYSESVDDLLAWVDEELSPRLTLSLYPEEGATYAPDDVACQWCPARGTCPALTEARLASAATLFDVIQDAEVSGNSIDPLGLDDDRLGELLAQAKAAHDLYSDLREEAQRRLHRGQAVAGYWLVNYSPNRTWKPGAEDALAEVEVISEEKWEEMFTDPALRSPAQVEKILGREVAKQITDLIDVPDKRPVISTGPADKRKRWEGRAPEDMFGIEEGDE